VELGSHVVHSKLMRRRALVATAFLLVAVIIIAVASRDSRTPPKGPSVTSHAAGAYADIPLDEAGMKALQTLVKGYSGMVDAELIKANVREPVFAVALVPGQQSGLDVAPYIGIGTEADRKRLLASDKEFGSTYIWNANEYSDGNLIEASFLDPPQYIVEAWNILAPRLEGKVPEPALWTLARVAYRLNRDELPLDLTDDSVVYAYDDDGGADQTFGLQYSALPEHFALLEQRGYIP
jgi:hypothetical protein